MRGRRHRFFPFWTQTDIEFRLITSSRCLGILDIERISGTPFRRSDRGFDVAVRIEADTVGVRVTEELELIHIEGPGFEHVIPCSDWNEGDETFFEAIPQYKSDVDRRWTETGQERSRCGWDGVGGLERGVDGRIGSILSNIKVRYKSDLRRTWSISVGNDLVLTWRGTYKLLCENHTSYTRIIMLEGETATIFSIKSCRECDSVASGDSRVSLGALTEVHAKVERCRSIGCLIPGSYFPFSEFAYEGSESIF